MELTEKMCSRCNIIKPIEQFYPRSTRTRVGYHPHCKDCSRDRFRESKNRRKVPCSECGEPSKSGRCRECENKSRAGTGDGSYTRRGYRTISVDGRNVLEHRHTMEQILGRQLMKGENVHHINGVRDDNRPENLELWITQQPSGQRVADLVEWAEEILRRYA